MYLANQNRYNEMPYHRCGNSGLKLPAISLGLWHNFGGINSYENSREMLRRAFDLGITHLDLANNYGPPYGSAELTLGQALKDDLSPYRDELIISTKAGFDMWPGPYGDFGSKKYLMASLDQSLKRMGLDYVDIFYHHRPDPETPLEETMGALDLMVRQGKALYVGISNYGPKEAKKAIDILNDLKTPCLIHQASYSMYNRSVEEGLLEVLEEERVGCIAFSPLAGGKLTNRYLNGIPADSRAAGPSRFMHEGDINDRLVQEVRALSEIAKERGQSLAQMSLAWVLRQPAVTSVLIGASKVSQIEDCVGTINRFEFTKEELEVIDSILKR